MESVVMRWVAVSYIIGLGDRRYRLNRDYQFPLEFVAEFRGIDEESAIAGNTFLIRTTNVLECRTSLTAEGPVLLGNPTACPVGVFDKVVSDVADTRRVEVFEVRETL